MADNRLSKSRIEGYVNGDQQFNFGGWVPPVEFPYGVAYLEMKGGCGIANKSISTLDWGITTKGIIYEDYNVAATSRIGFCFPLEEPHEGLVYDIEWVYPSGWYVCGNYWDRVEIELIGFSSQDSLGKYWNAEFRYYRGGYLYSTITDFVRYYFNNFLSQGGCEYNIVFPITQTRTDNVVPSPTPTPTPSSTPIP
jgi:hypothetical protein